MYVVAVIGDLLSLVPFLNMFSGVITGMVLGFIGSVEDVPLYSEAEILPTIATFVAEEIPGIAMLPIWTIRVYFAKRTAKMRKEQGQS